MLKNLLTTYDYKSVGTPNGGVGRLAWCGTPSGGMNDISGEAENFLSSVRRFDGFAIRR